MLKFYNYAVTFSEFPDEIALCVYISGCPIKCPGCSSPWLQEDTGTDLTTEVLDKLIADHYSCSVFGIMGGDQDIEDIRRVAQYVKSHSRMKVGFFSGRNSINLSIIPDIDIYKIGSWIMPEGDVNTWHTKNCGPIQFPFSNQLYFEKVHGVLINSTYKFRERPLSNLERYIVRDGAENSADA